MEWFVVVLFKFVAIHGLNGTGCVVVIVVRHKSEPFSGTRRHIPLRKKERESWEQKIAPLSRENEFKDYLNVNFGYCAEWAKKTIELDLRGIGTDVVDEKSMTRLCRRDIGTYYIIITYQRFENIRSVLTSR